MRLAPILWSSLSILNERDFQIIRLYLSASDHNFAMTIIGRSRWSVWSSVFKWKWLYQTVRQYQRPYFRNDDTGCPSVQLRWSVRSMLTHELLCLSRRSSPNHALVGVIVNCKIVQVKVGGVRNSICQPNPFGFILYPKNTFITLFVTRALVSLLKSWCVYNWGPAMYLTQLYYLSLIQTTSSTSVHPPTLSLSPLSILPRLTLFSTITMLIVILVHISIQLSLVPSSYVCLIVHQHPWPRSW